eukprot:11294458-Prorocentrum_lima.AAC.1
MDVQHHARIIRAVCAITVSTIGQGMLMMDTQHHVHAVHAATVSTHARVHFDTRNVQTCWRALCV